MIPSGFFIVRARISLLSRNVKQALSCIIACFEITYIQCGLFVMIGFVVQYRERPIQLFGEQRTHYLV